MADGNDMSNFVCEHCGAEILEGYGGHYVTGCEHYPIEAELQCLKPSNATGNKVDRRIEPMLKAAIKKIEDLERQKVELSNHITQAYRDMEALSPYKPGDIIVVNGYTHKGKQMVVDSVAAVQSYNGIWEWIVSGRVLKKDGSPGSNTADSRFKVFDSDRA